MTYTLRPAITSEAKPLIGFYSESEGGKTHSALLLACGFCDGDMSKVAMIETEAGRGEALADDPVVGGYQVIPLRSNFSPKEYGQAIAAVEAAKMRAMIIDSASHEWEGIGGVLDMAATNQAPKTEGGKELRGPLVWQRPKMDHQKEFMLRLMQSPVPLVIVCMRAKYPMYQVKAADLKAWEDAGRPGGTPPKVGDWARSWELEPKQSDDILFEMFVHGWFDKERHAFHATKYTRPAMREIFVDGEPVTVETGKRLAAWAAGRKIEYITQEQADQLDVRCTENDIPIDRLKRAARVERLTMIKAEDLKRAQSWLDAAIAAKNKPTTTQGQGQGALID